MRVACDEDAWVVADGWEPYPRPVPVRFEFDSTDALAVRMLVHGMVWSFARALLRVPAAASGEKDKERWRGEGDVRIASTSETVCIALSAPDGRATLVMPVRPIQAFLSRTDEIVPSGQESYDVDTWIGRMLQEEERT